MPLPDWAWCIATYNRHDMLVRSCALALQQTAPPSEIIITDASADWERGRDRIERLLAVAAEAHGVRPRLSYAKASKASAAAQRNESIARANADVVFVFDDDTLMFPDTAEKIIEVYSRDSEGVVQAVTAANVPQPPRAPDWLEAVVETEPETSDRGAPEGVDLQPAQKRSTGPLAEMLRRFLRAKDRFVPYDPNRRKHDVPASLQGLGLRSWRLAAGFHLTVRREAALCEPFEERLKGYSPGEDSDMTYRLTRHGPILHRPDARIHHAEAPGSRFGVFRRVALGATNSLLLQRVHSTDRAFSERESRALLRRLLVIEFMKDTKALDWRLPRTRATAYALRNVKTIMTVEDEKIDEYFEYYQSLR